MATIVVYGDPVLTQKSETVEEFNDELEDLVREMHRTMIKAEGVGLAAPQVGISKQLAIVDTSGGKDPKQLIVLINPEIVETEGLQKGEEGCLSFPDITTVIDRPEQVKIRAQNTKGEWLTHRAEGFLARAFCHEIDHLNGTLIIDRVSRLKRDLIKKKIQKRIKAETWHS